MSSPKVMVVGKGQGRENEISCSTSGGNAADNEQEVVF